MGFGEQVLILLVVVIVFGSTKLPQLGEYLEKALHDRQLEDRLLIRARHAWSRWDWLLVAAVVMLGIAALGLALSRH
jgi:Sec-independent protein translocase protein TatA